MPSFENILNFCFRLLTERTVFLSVAAFIFLIFQLALPVSSTVKRSVREIIVDLLCVILNIFFSAPIIMVLGILTALYFSSQHYFMHKFLYPVPTIGQILLAIFVSDFIGYWRHRFTHMRWLWPVHAPHHSIRYLSWLSAERFHPINTVINNICALFALYILGFPAEIMAYERIFRLFYNYFNHANIKVSFGPINYLLVTPEFHRWHHSTDRHAQSCNFAVVFSVLDLVFGTYFLPKKCTPNLFGLENQVKDYSFGEFIMIPAKTYSLLTHKLF